DLTPLEEMQQRKSSKLPLFVALAAALAAAAAIFAWVRASSNGGPVPSAQASMPAVATVVAPAKPTETTPPQQYSDPSPAAPRVAVPGTATAKAPATTTATPTWR